MEKNKKSVWTLVLTIVKYAVAAALGFLGGDSDIINEIL